MKAKEVDIKNKWRRTEQFHPLEGFTHSYTHACTCAYRHACTGADTNKYYPGD